MILPISKNSICIYIHLNVALYLGTYICSHRFDRGMPIEETTGHYNADEWSRTLNEWRNRIGYLACRSKGLASKGVNLIETSTCALFLQYSSTNTIIHSWFCASLIRVLQTAPDNGNTWLIHAVICWRNGRKVKSCRKITAWHVEF